VTSERIWAAAVRRHNKPMEPTGRSRDRFVGVTRASSREQPPVVGKGGLRLIGQRFDRLEEAGLTDVRQWRIVAYALC